MAVAVDEADEEVAALLGRKASSYEEIVEEDGVPDESAYSCLLYTSPSPRDATLSRMPSSA